MKPKTLSRIVNTVSGGAVKYGWYTSSYRSEKSPIILGGASRSGTTLFRSLLDAHSQISIGPETAILSQGNNQIDHLARVTELDPDLLRKYYKQACCLAEFGELVLEEIMNRDGKKRWGEKTPDNIRNMETIFRFFPNARFIHIIRDGRDVVCSLRTHPKYKWENGQRVPTGIINPWASCVQEWEQDVKTGMKWRGDSRYLEVRYENIVRYPEGTLREVLKWLGEAWEPGIMESYKTDKIDSQPRLNESINGAAIGRWKKDLPEEILNQHFSGQNSLLNELDYTTEFPWANSM